MLEVNGTLSNTILGEKELMMVQQVWALVILCMYVNHLIPRSSL